MDPVLAVVDVPDLPAALSAAGFDLVSTRTSVADVARAVRACPDTQPVLVVAAATTDAKTRTWLGFQANQPQHWVLVLGEDPGIPNVGWLELPATLGEIAEAFGTPELDSASAQVRVLADLSVSAPVVASDPGFFDPFAEDEDFAPQSPATPVVAPITRQPQFEAPSPQRIPARGIPASEFADEFDEPDTFEFEAVEPEPEPDPEPEPVVTRRQRRRERPVVSPEPEPVRPSGSFESDLAPVSRGNEVVRRGGLCPVVVVMAGKGGVGKTSFSLSLAQRAVEAGDPALQRVVLVDGNRGQGDVRKAMRLMRANLPTIYDAALHNRPKSAIIGPKRLLEHRDERLPSLGFGVVFAPRDGQADPAVVSTGVYSQVVAAARGYADLVIVDTQVLEAYDTSGLWDNLWTPLLASEAWGLGLSDDSSFGADNLLVRFQELQERGVNPARMMSALNIVSPDTPLDLAEAEKRLSRYSRFVGMVSQSDGIKQELGTGRIPSRNPELAPVLDSVLKSVTGLSAFDPRVGGSRAANRRGIFSLFGRK